MEKGIIFGNNILDVVFVAWFIAQFYKAIVSIIIDKKIKYKTLLGNRRYAQFPFINSKCFGYLGWNCLWNGNTIFCSYTNYESNLPKSIQKKLISCNTFYYFFGELIFNKLV